MSSSMSSNEAQAMAQYMNQFLDLVDNLPNDISRHLSQLHVLNNSYEILFNRLGNNYDNYNKLENHDNNDKDSCGVKCDDRRRLGKKIESQLIQMQEISDEKLRCSQIIIDLIESKAKELDFDYEDIMRLNELLENNTNSNRLYQKSNLNSSKSNHSSQQSTSGTVEEQKQMTNGDNNKGNDKRLLPRRACALKPGEMDESNFDLMPKLIKEKSTKIRSNNKYSKGKSHKFQSFSMSNYFRDMARKRAKNPIKKVKKSVQLAIKQKANKSNQKTISTINKNHIISNSGPKYRKANNELFKSLRNKKSVNNKINKKKSMSSSSTSSISSDSSSSDSNNYIQNDKKNTFTSVKPNSTQMNGKKETKKSVNNLNNSINIKANNKKSNKSQNDMFIGEPIDPNEPLYCICGQVSYGDMICCDNEMCQLEWFHFPCVDLVHKPKGKWFCPKCRGDRSNVPKKLSQF